MAVIQVYCPECTTIDVYKFGITEQGKQRYCCKNSECSKKAFILDDSNKACAPGMKEKIIERALNSSGIRDTGRVLGISKGTVMSTLKKASTLQVINKRFLDTSNANKLEVHLSGINEAEMDEMWSFVRCKKKQRLLSGLLWVQDNALVRLSARTWS